MTTTLTYADAELGPTGDLVLPTRPVRGPELVRQRLEARLRAHRGEWFLDTDFGLPYADWTARLPVPLAEIELALTEIIGTTPGVARVSGVVCSFDSASREVRYSATIRLGDADDGTAGDALVIQTFVTGAGASRVYLQSMRPGAIIP